MNYRDLGFKAGLEIHQQLDTKKLFCDCPSELSEEYDFKFERLLRPTQSELGELDRAALAEAEKKRRFLYFSSKKSSCLVESDEEPPHEMNREALEIGLKVALMMKARIVDEIQVMRKIVIDGSNTSGFQRTALIALKGKVKDVGIETIAIEEDAARKIEERGNVVSYGIDRLGIPLIEVATSAELRDPKHAKEIAEYIGSIFKSVGKCKRVLGAIRQDINVSIRDGARVEIKGVQYLSAIERVAEKEVLRQLDLLEIKKILKERGIRKKDIDREVLKDLTEIMKDCESKIIRKGIEEGKKVLALRLPGFSGLLKRDYSRLGREFAVHARIKSGIKGLIHSDELPGYGIDESCVRKIGDALDLKKNDAFVIFVGDTNVVEKAVTAVKNRAKQALVGVPEEVRRALPDDSTEYMRPLPGSARMYPETDIPPIRVTNVYIEKLKRELPEEPEKMIERISKEYELSIEQARQLFNSGYIKEFEELAKDFPEIASVVARTFLNTIPELERERYDVSWIDQKILYDLFSNLMRGEFAKEAIPDILAFLSKSEKKVLELAIKKFGGVDIEEVRRFIKRVVRERREFVRERGMSALGPLMGVVMKEFRGKVDGKVVSEILKEEIEKEIST